MKRYFLIAALCAVFAFPVFGQSIDFMDRIAGSSGIAYGDAAYLVLVATDNIAEDAGTARSLDLAKEMKWVNPSIQAEAPMRLDGFSFLLMKSFGMKGGLLYRAFPGARYAYRELVSRGVIQGDYDPADKVDGALAVRMIGRVFSIME